MITRLVSGLYGGRRSGSFASKTITANTHPVGRITRLVSGLYGGRRAGSFAGKTDGSTSVIADYIIFARRFARR